MPGTLAALDVVKSYGGTTVLDRVSLHVTPGARIGVVGPNGSGKSTLLRVLGGLEAPDGGSVVRAPASVEVGYLPQERESRSETVVEYLARRSGVAAAEERVAALAGRLAAEPRVADEYATALERLLALAGGDFDARVRAVCADVGLPAAALGRLLAELSGGERTRAALAAILLARFGVFLLDEPTNDLDFAGLRRLERFVLDSDASFVIVSHDRAFLEATVEDVLVFEAETRRVSQFGGGFAAYETALRRRRERHEAEYERYAGERERFASLLRERRGEARAGGKMANRRGTHALASKVRAAERRLEQLDPVEKPWSPWQLRLEVEPAEHGPDVVGGLSGAVVERGSFRLGPIDLELRRGDRVAIVGPNGSGKSTLLDALLGRLPLVAGKQWLGRGARIGEVDQARTLFAGAQPLADAFAARSGLAPQAARTLLAKFALGHAEATRPASTLSPGERTRAALALLSARGVNCLVLDEPTNHLDLEAIAELERVLAGFPGTVVLVTHDRRLLEVFEPTATVELGQASHEIATR